MDKYNARRRRRIRIEIGLIFAGAVLVFFVAALIDSAELLIPLLERYERFELDEFLIVFIYLAVVLAVFSSLRWRELSAAYKELTRRNQDLQKTLDEVKELRGILPICASCKKVRDDSGYWQQVESYITNHSRLRFSHGFCPDCAGKLYPKIEEPEASTS